MTKKVLIAEKNQYVRQAIRLLLEQQERYMVVGVSDQLPEWKSIPEQNTPELLLVGVEFLGEVPGRVLKTLRERFPSAVIIVTSGRIEDRENVTKEGVDGFLLKNLPPDLFLSHLSDQLSTSSFA